MSDQDRAVREQNGRAATTPRHIAGRGECSSRGIVKLGAGQPTDSETAPYVGQTKASGDQDSAVGKQRSRVPVAGRRHIARCREASRRRVVQLGARKNRWDEEAATWCLASGNQDLAVRKKS